VIKLLTIFIALVLLFLGVFFQESWASDSSKINCTINRSFPYSDYTADINFSGSFNSRYWIIQKIHYKLRPRNASSDQNNFVVYDQKTKRQYYSSPDSLNRSGRWESYRTRFRLPKNRPITIRFSFDEAGQPDPDCYRDFAI